MEESTAISDQSAHRAIDKGRARGCLLGLAIGDALGAIVEFGLPGAFEPVTGHREGGYWGIPAGAFTDDTSQALCLAHSLLEAGFSQQDQLTRYVDWWKNGYMSSDGGPAFDVGTNTRRALEMFLKDPTCVPGESLPEAGGGGAIMRLAPLPIWAQGRSDLEQLAEQSALTTHGAKEALDAARYMASLLNMALHAPADAPPDSVKEKVLAGVEISGDAHDGLRQIVGGSFRDLNVDEIVDGGYVLTCLESALWAIHKTDSFEEGMLLAVNLGLDSDTRGAVFGQIAGAIYGVDAIPEEWIEGLVMGEEIAGLADRLIEAERDEPEIL